MTQFTIEYFLTGSGNFQARFFGMLSEIQIHSEIPATSVISFGRIPIEILGEVLHYSLYDY